MHQSVISSRESGIFDPKKPLEVASNPVNLDCKWNTDAEFSAAIVSYFRQETSSTEKMVCSVPLSTVLRNLISILLSYT